MFCSAVSIVSHFSRLLSNFWWICYIIDPYALLQLAYYMLSDLLSDPWIVWVLLPPRNCSCCSLCLGCFPTLCKAGCFSSLGLQLKCPLLRSLSWWIILGISSSLTLSVTSSYLFLVVWSLSHVWLFATPWTAALQASLSFTISQSLLVRWVSDAIQPTRPLLPSSPPAVNFSQQQGFFPNESALCIRWPKYWNFSFSISPCSEYFGLIFFRIYF